MNFNQEKTSKESQTAIREGGRGLCSTSIKEKLMNCCFVELSEKS